MILQPTDRPHIKTERGTFYSMPSKKIPSEDSFH